ncbi:diguanylate cyclase [Desulfosporosinus sp.]|uniref:GGDEF domain-containing protein n=1 Tax=Desulfosporosinus sp. TaxID=157907 RepID=UPI0025C6573D|nr:diguanylate cyclase [Desulfosporosinus sp.]
MKFWQRYAMKKIRSLSKLTRTYISALSLIALLTLATFITMHLIILTQKDSALLVNLSGSQRWLSQKAALLSVELVYITDSAERDQSRKQLLSIINQLQRNHQALIEDTPNIISSQSLTPQMQKVFFSPPINLDTRFNKYTSEALALANEPEHLLTPDNPHFTYLLQNSENLLESLDQIVSMFQKESEAKVQRLGMVEITSGAAILLTLAFLGLYIFRPLADTLLNERSQLEKANQELSLLSSIDGLTGIANRRHFDQFLEQLWLHSARNSEPIAIILCDIDFFKAYNDTYGHLQGDECLRQVASSLKNSLKRPSDFVARYGGEEFVVVLPNTDIEGALTVAETLRVNLESLEIPHRLSSITPKVTISLGVAIGHADHTYQPKTLVEAADSALYQAKQEGRNRYKLANFAG